jgi:hypothetical protein
VVGRLHDAAHRVIAAFTVLIWISTFRGRCAVHHRSVRSQSTRHHMIASSGENVQSASALPPKLAITATGAVLRVCPGTLPAVSGRLPRKTPGPRWLTRRTRRRFLSSPAARSCAVAAALGVQPLETRRGSVLPIGHRLGSAGASAGWRTARVQRQPSSSRTSVGAATVAMIANRTVAKTAAANKMATPFIKAPCIPRQEYLPLPCCRMEVRPALLESTGNFGTVADP